MPELLGAEESFQVWRGYYYAKNFGDVIDRSPETYKGTIRWNTEYGRGLTASDLGKATSARTRLRQRVLDFLEIHRFLAIPTSAVAPFPITQEYPTHINVEEIDNYTSWFASCYYISEVELPAISIPAGFTGDGLPVGLQIVGRHHADLDVLRAAFAIQQATELWKPRAPILERQSATLAPA